MSTIEYQYRNTDSEAWEGPFYNWQILEQAKVGMIRSNAEIARVDKEDVCFALSYFFEGTPSSLVTVNKIDVDFGNAVGNLIMWGFAAIPAAMILGVVYWILWLVAVGVASSF